MENDSTDRRHPLLQQDRLMGFATVAVSLFLLWETFYFPETHWDPLGIAFWPRTVLGGMLLIGTFLIYRGRVVEGFERVDWRGGVILGAGAGYVLLLPSIGFLLLTPPFMFLAVMLIGGRWTRGRIVEALVVAVVSTVTIFFVFQEALLVRLPEGLLY
jgi:putative tricarboxylic transport membrane protein